jgi:hypothetical protein
VKSTPQIPPQPDLTRSLRYRSNGHELIIPIGNLQQISAIRRESNGTRGFCMKRYGYLILVVDALINGTGAFFVPAAEQTQTTVAQSLPMAAPSPEVTAS